MNNAEIMKSIEKAQERETTFSFNVGDTVKVSALIKEGTEKESRLSKEQLSRFRVQVQERLSQLERTLTALALRRHGLFTHHLSRKSM